MPGGRVAFLSSATAVTITGRRTLLPRCGESFGHFGNIGKDCNKLSADEVQFSKMRSWEAS